MTLAWAGAVQNLVAAAGLALAAACVADGNWFTPSGVALGRIDCTSPAPLEGRTGAEICLARLIADTPEAAGQCRREGGTVGQVSIIDKRRACSYRKG